MKNKIAILIFSFFIHDGLKAQQNFFNVPSSDITEHKKMFFQQQFNLLTTNIVSNTTLSYGLKNNFEIGVNLLGVTYDYTSKGFVSSDVNDTPVYPSFGVNAQKSLIMLKDYSLMIGGQLLFPSQLKNLEYYTYINNKIEIPKTKLIAGLYYGNNNYLGNETRFSNSIQNFGLQFGFEYEAINDKLFIQGDYISGKTAMSNLILGGAYKYSKHIYLSAGYQMPNSKISSSDALIFEFTFIQ